MNPADQRQQEYMVIIKLLGEEMHPVVSAKKGWMRNSRTMCDEQDMMNDGKLTRSKACTRAMQRGQCRTGIASKLPTMVKLISIATNALRTTISHCARETTGLITLVRGPNAGTPRTRSNWFSIVCCETCDRVVWLLYFWFAGAAGVEPTME